MLAVRLRRFSVLWGDDRPEEANICSKNCYPGIENLVAVKGKPIKGGVMRIQVKFLFIPFFLFLALNMACGKGEKKEAGKIEEITQKPIAVTDTTNPIVLMKTSMGDIELELNTQKAPKTVANFLSYVQDGFYDGTIFHRVIGNFMIQGGGFTPDMKQKETKPPILNEAGNGLKNLRGTIAMARTPEVNSATSQFFINVVDNPNLDHKDETPKGFGYAVFGKVIKGMDVVDKIKEVKKTAKRYHQNVPVEPVIIQSMKVVN